MNKKPTLTQITLGVLAGMLILILLFAGAVGIFKPHKLPPLLRKGYHSHHRR